MEFINVDPTLKELNSFTTQVETYHTGRSSFLANPTIGPPIAKEAFRNLSTVESISASSTTRKLSSNNISGYLTDLANHLGATDREMSMRYKSKSAHYEEAISEVNQEIRNNRDMQAEYTAAISGKMQAL